MPESAGFISESEQPPATGRRRMGCFGIAALVACTLLLIVLLFWWAWISGATSRRDAAWEKLRAAGIATSAAELAAQVKPVPDELNPVVEYEEAWALLDQEHEALQAWGNFDIPESVRTPEEQAQFEEYERSAVEAFAVALEITARADAKIRPAVQQVRGDFGVWSGRSGALPPDMFSTLLPHLNELRWLAMLVAADANVAALDGDGERVLRDAIRLIGMADALDSDAHMLVEHLVAVGIRSLAVNAVLRNAEAAAGGPGELKAAVIALLLDDAPGAAGYASAMAGEATMQQSIMREMDSGRMTLNSVGGGGTGAVPAVMLRPLMRDDAAQMAHWMLALRDLADVQRLAEAKDKMPDSAWLSQTRVRDLFATLLLPSLDRAVEAEFRIRTERRLAATVLAIRSYQRDHGQLPHELVALVPDYLPLVPIDPLSAGADLKYDAERALLWSVGIDGVDDSGDETPVGRRPDDHWTWKDRVIQLR